MATTSYMTINHVIVEKTIEDFWTAYTFTIGGNAYFMPHMHPLPENEGCDDWEIMMDVDEEFVSIAVGAEACRAWLSRHALAAIMEDSI